jgi:glycosyltransferase involved in cell wall biosynthesis
VVPVFNGAETLGQTLGSLTAQGEDLKEIIVVDDGSADGSQSIAETFARRDARVMMVRHGENQVLARTLNDGIARASGEAVLIIQQDCELLNGDWVSRGLGLLRENQPCCVSANPAYPFREMTPVDIAFGLLRDHFTPMEGEKEQLGFSEFKCDLIPRAALGDAPFDTRFRISGEDQVLSEKLWGAGYPILRFRGLTYVQRSGGTSSLGSQLRKEWSMGRARGVSSYGRGSARFRAAPSPSYRSAGW